MKVLVVVDMQNDFISGSLGTPEAQAIVQRVAEKIDRFNGDIICLTLDTHYSNYLIGTQEGKLFPVPHCQRNTDGREVHPDVIAAFDRYHARSAAYDVQAFPKETFGSTDMGAWLKKLERFGKIDEVTLVGLCTDVCVISNALLLKAFLPEARIVVDASCCAGATPEGHKTALSAMKTCQIFVENEEE